MRLPRGRWLLLSALVLSAARPVLAADAAGRRVLLIEPGRDPFLERVGAEIEGLGFTLVRADAQGPLEASARAAQAVAAIRVLPSRKGVEVWMADATSGRSLLRQVVVDENPQGPDRDLIALQTAELLRTSLLGGKSAGTPSAQPSPAAPAPPPRAPVSNASTPTASTTGLQLNLGALFNPGGAGASAQLGLSFQHFFSEPWGFGLDLAMPLHSGAITAVEGSATIGTYLAGALLLARLQQRTSPLFATAGAGGGLLFIDYDARTSEPLRSNAGHRLAGVAYLRIDAGLAASAWFRFGLRALAGTSFPRITVRFAGNEAGDVGTALLAALAFAELALP